MNIAQVESNVKGLIDKLTAGNLPNEDFIYELLVAYGHRASTVCMLRKGPYNIAKVSDEIIFKRHLYFKQVQGNTLHAELDRMKNQKLIASNRTRFVICTNFEHLLAVDIKTSDSLDIALAELPRKFDFFLPWAGLEKAVYQGENPADVKAAEKMAKLFDLIKADNFKEESAGDKAAPHNLNVFLTRMLFCLFAEDTEIFLENQFSNAIQGHTSDDGSDLAQYLDRLFTVLNTPEKERSELPDYLSGFPYVNGGLFANVVPSPAFSRKSRRMLSECGSDLNWSDINPDIFGSMIQAVVHPDQRGGMGMHYTSVTNIMKVIEPLFLNALYEELEKVSNSATKLKKLQQRLGEIKIFDPACGSGNFLIIAYKELRRLEMELLKRWQEVALETTGQVFQAFSVINLSQFYGIELDDFAHEVAVLSLWLTEHQMNMEFQTEFGKTLPLLPLKNSGHICCGNAARIDWSQVCPITPSDEAYLLGNPPYLGARNQSGDQKEDMSIVYEGHEHYKDADYVSCWLVLASKYILSKNAAFAFVTTNSITQGEQVSYVWSRIFAAQQEIFFAYQSFKWRNNAKQNAGVTCVIVGVRNRAIGKKTIFNDQTMLKQEAKNIGPYLTHGQNNFVSRSHHVISWLPKMVIGNMARDGGNLILTEEEKVRIMRQYPKSVALFRKLYGTQEWIKGSPRYALWIKDSQLQLAREIPPIKERIQKVYDFRITSKAKTTNQYAKTPYRFAQRFDRESNSIIVPSTTSERRKYIPIGFMGPDVVITNSANAIFDARLCVFGVISSYLHMLWVKSIGGQLETRIRYSPEICYNTFPIPELTEKQVADIEVAASEVISAREGRPDLNIETLYDPDSMPDMLRDAHLQLDVTVEMAILGKLVPEDNKKLELLLDMYTQMTGGQYA